MRALVGHSGLRDTLQLRRTHLTAQVEETTVMSFPAQPLSHPLGSPYKWVLNLKVQEVSPSVGSGLPLSPKESSPGR